MVLAESPRARAFPHAEPRLAESTRYLCAAAHLSRDFADAALREMLVEPTRPVVPAPEVDTATVLDEALAARLRTDLVDAALLFLVALVVVVAPSLAVLWGVVALALSLPRLLRAVRERAARTGRRVRPVRVVVAALLPVLGVLWTDDDPRSLLTAAMRNPAGLALVVLALGVLLLNRFAIAHQVVSRFGPLRRGLPPPRPDRSLHRFAPRLATRAGDSHLHAPRPGPGVSEKDGSVPLLVHRGYKPFVGAGDVHDPWTIAIPLERKPDAPPGACLDTATLLEAITTKVEELRGAPLPVPGGRLGALRVDDLVIASARGLVDHLPDPVSAHYLRGPGERPYTHVPRAHAAELRDRPLEWARFYRRFTVQTWDGDLVLSVFVHVAMDSSTLYLEWTPCVLRPIDADLKAVDNEPATPWAPVGRAVKDLVLLPASVVARAVRLVVRPRALPPDRGRVNPDKYGSLLTLREMAADPELDNYFQQADVERYTNLLRTRVTLAVAEVLRDAGCYTASFDQQVQSVVNNTINVGEGGALSGPVLQTGSLHGDVDITG